ncbi:MAG: hypothetical protein ACHQ6U_08285 [Thermodesulfobacteriota bacterium]
MSKKKFYFVLSIPRDEIIEYSTKLSSYISKFFPGTPNPFTLKPLAILENEAITKISLECSEEKIREFAGRFFEDGYELLEQDSGEVEIIRTGDIDKYAADDGEILKH